MKLDSESVIKSGWEKGNKKLEKGGPNLFIRGTMNQVKWHYRSSDKIEPAVPIKLL
jgi:hypothetical protein